MDARSMIISYIMDRLTDEFRMLTIVEGREHGEQ